MKPPKLARLEVQILEVLWGFGKGSIREIQEMFTDPKPAYTTIQNNRVPAGTEESRCARAENRQCRHL